MTLSPPLDEMLPNVISSDACKNELILASRILAQTIHTDRQLSSYTSYMRVEKSLKVVHGGDGIDYLVFSGGLDMDEEAEFEFMGHLAGYMMLTLLRNRR